VTGFTLREMIINGWPVLTVLLIMSIVSVTILWERLSTMRQAKLDAKAFIDGVLRVLEQEGAAPAAEYCRRFRKPMARVAAEVLLKPGGREARQRASDHAVEAQVRELQMYIPILGTIASTAPFVGLFGTVVGIIRAFQDIASNVGGGPEVVAAGIAEALITTAFGLFVAIPAVMGYNYFVHQVQRIAEEMDLAVYDLIERLADDK
jgi:biopolymer transport protein ExbB